MLKLALKDAPIGSSISKFELESNVDVNYSIDTVKYFVKKYPNDKLYFLIGADQVNKFHEWKDADMIASMCQIIFSNRPNNALNENNIARYKMMSLDFNESGEVSSTDIRELRSIDVPVDVLKYIEDKKLYFVNKLSMYLTESRLAHSISVANLAYRIALVNKLERPERFYIAGILHDLGKTYSAGSENSIEFMEKRYPEYVDLPKFSYHQFIGEYLAKNDFGVVDEEILDAIKWHCTGKANMNQIGMVVYAADKIEPSRPFDSRWLINSCLKNWKQGFLDTLEDNRKYLLAHAKDIENKYTKECMDMYLERK